MIMNNRKSSCSIALMSGKGGSGKTTLALSMASILSSSNVKTLLVDCDLSTNGATYFFEDEMAYSVNDIDTLQELMVKKESLNLNPYHVNQYFDFLPSVTIIGDYYNPDDLTRNAKGYLEDLFFCLADKYEVIIYDCQAGFTQLLEIIIGHVDRNLMVLEADSVSASAVRNLFLKLNKAWNKTKVYQVFNKATKEEAEIYSKVTSGTTFDNIGCVLFDWTVRRAFSTSQIPDMDHTSTDYGYQISELCNALIKYPSINRRLNYFIAKRKLEELDIAENKAERVAKETTAEKAIWEQKIKKKKTYRFFYEILPLLTALVALGFSVYVINNNLTFVSVHSLNSLLIMFVSFLTGFVATLLIRYGSNSNVENEFNIRRLDNQIAEAVKKQKNYQNQIMNLEKNISQLEEMLSKEDSSNI